MSSLHLPNWLTTSLFGKLARQAENGVNRDFPYDMQNRLLTGYGQSYTYDSVGRLTSYENTGQTMNGSFPAHAIKNSGYTYDNNGNMTGRSGKTLDWDHENRLQQVKNGSTVLESYLYDADGVRVKKTVGSTSTYYPNQFYEQTGATITKYYYFNGQRVAMRVNGTLTYLHSDHLSSTVMETNSSGGLSTDEKYYAYGRQRDSGSVTTAPNGHPKYTGQKLDGTGLYYYNARYG
ncbi:MAG: hypothetical protein R3C14_42220 [Caldilineaceae bacterium]